MKNEFVPHCPELFISSFYKFMREKLLQFQLYSDFVLFCEIRELVMKPCKLRSLVTFHVVNLSDNLIRKWKEMGRKSNN